MLIKIENTVSGTVATYKAKRIPRRKEATLTRVDRSAPSWTAPWPITREALRLHPSQKLTSPPTPTDQGQTALAVGGEEKN